MYKITKFFDAVVSDDGSNLNFKPEPDYLLKCTTILGVKPENSIYIGDQGSDIEAANAANITPIGVRWGFGTNGQLMKKKRDIDTAVTVRALESILYKLLKKNS